MFKMLFSNTSVDNNYFDQACGLGRASKFANYYKSNAVHELYNFNTI